MDDSQNNVPSKGARDIRNENATAYERVEGTIATNPEPLSAPEIAEKADVSEPTARKHVTSLVDIGQAIAIQGDGLTRYKRSPAKLVTEQIADIHASYTKEQLMRKLETMQSELDGFREEYDTQGPDDLSTEVESSDATWEEIRRWRTLESNYKIAKAALLLYDIDPDAGNPNPESSTQEDSPEEPVGEDIGVLGRADWLA